MTEYVYRRAQTYNDCLKRYKKDSLVKSQLFDALEELERDPLHSPQLNTHRVKRANGKTYTSDVGGRKGKRLIWRLVGERTIVLLLFGEHDPTYRRAESLTLEYDEGTDAIRVLDERSEQTQPITYAERRQLEGTLFMAYTDAALKEFGFHAQEIPVLRRLEEDGELLALEDRMRPEAWHMAVNLFLYGHPEGEAAAAQEREAAELAEASQPEPAVDEGMEEKLARAVLSPGSSIELPPVAGDLAEALTQPIEDWMVFLHPDQRDLAERAYSGPARVRGAAGTGKTVVGLHRAAYLARAYDEPVLFTTYIRTLPPVLEQLFARLAPDLEGRVEFRSVHSWAAGYLHSIGRHLNIDPARVAASFNAAWSECAAEGSPLAASELPKDYFREEIDWIIRGRGCRQRSDYLRLRRSGRGTPLGENLRKNVWALYEEYRHQLIKRKTYDFSSLIQEALREVRERGRPTRYAAVIVDEAQDLTEVGIKLLYELAGRDKPDGLLILGDGQQAIYPGGFSLGAVGIDVRGRSTVLKTNYRNTAEILGAALDIVEDSPYDDLDPELSAGQRDVTILRRGPEPTRQVFVDADVHDLALGEALVEASSTTGADLGDLAVLVPTRASVQHYIETISELGLRAQNLEDYEGLHTDAVKVGTFKRSKGLEFKQVFLPRLDLCEISDEEDRDDVDSERADLLRRSLFVALTRARDSAWLGGLAPHSDDPWWIRDE